MPELHEQLTAALTDHYIIERQIGAGGMAVVYLARDLKHDRKVALKVLNPELGVVLGADRFLSEIRVTANLQHPNLLPLFDSGEADGLLYYVMPYVQGESLRATLAREKQLPVEDALHIAIAVASALDYAHRHGVIHRDLKPENILLHEGQPLVADFGIALAVSNAGGNRITQTGLSLGTPQYMSPEQATGDRVIDARADVYSLGAVLYEMLTGEPPHTGNTSQAVIARVLTETPRRVRATRATVPEHVESAIERALEKLPADRFTTAQEFADALHGGMTGASRAATSPAMAPGDVFVIRVPMHIKRRLKAAIPWTTAVAAIALAGVTALRAPRTTEDRGWPTLFPVTFSDSIDVLTPGGVTLAISRDGSQIAFDAASGVASGIFLRRLDALDARFVRGSEGGTRPEFSPDGTWLLFTSADGKLKKVPAGGGAPITLYDSAHWESSWGDRNEIVFGSGSGTLLRISADGGAAIDLASPDSAKGHLYYAWPIVLPGAKAALITIWKRSRNLEDAELGMMRLRDGRITELGVRGTGPRYAPSGHVLFGRADGSIFAAPFSLRGLRLTGPAVPVLEGVIVKSGGAVEIALSDNGTLIYKGAASAPYRSLVRVDRQGVERPLGVDSLAVSYPRISRDGRRIAVTVMLPAPDIWTKDLANGTFTRVTSGGTSQRPEWTPDRRRLAYWSSDSAGNVIKAQPWDGSGVPELFAQRAEEALTEISFGPAGSYVAVRRGTIQGADILIAPADSPQALRLFVATPVMEVLPRISPNGSVLAYVSDETGRREVYVRPLPGPGGRVQVSITGGDEPMWGADGSMLYYRAPTQLMAAVIRERPELDVLRRDSLFPDGYMRNVGHANFDVFPNGKEFVFVKNVVPERPRLMGIANWTSELRRRTQGTTSR
ncbi:MAG: protein kinase [Gemmatimonadaceae bacterium]